MKTELDFKSVLLLQLFYLLQNVRSKHHCSSSRQSDEDSQSQENNSDLDELPVVNIETPVPLNIPQLNQVSMTLPQLIFPQMSMPFPQMTAGSYPTSLFPSQRLVFFRVPSSYVNILKAMLPSDHKTAVKSENSTATATKKPQVVNTTISSVTTMITVTAEDITTVPTTTQPTLEPESNEVTEPFASLRFKNDSDLFTKTEKEDEKLDIVLQNIMNEFSERLINTSLTEEKEVNQEVSARRMAPPSIRKTKPISIISQVRILPIPDKMAKALLSHLRTMKNIPTARKKRNAAFNLK